MEVIMTLGEKIYRLRTEQGLSQETFGDKLGVSRQSVSKWETDQSVPELDKIVAISELFGVSTDYLLKATVSEMSTNAQNITASIQNPSGNVPGAEGETPREDGFLQIEYLPGQKRRFEYKSKKMIGSLPLVHIGRRAKGVIAIGFVAQGWLSLGLASMGGISVGIVSLGLLSLATISFGLVAIGSFAFGVISMGAIAVGIFSMGALTFGQFAFGAAAHGTQVAIGDVASGKVALVYTRATGIYTQLSNRQPFDYEEACRAIDMHVSSNWLFFKTWAKGMIRWF